MPALLHRGRRPGEHRCGLHLGRVRRRTNFELANEWGNLVNRSISMAHKNMARSEGPPAEIDQLLRRRRRRLRLRRRPARPEPVQAGDQRGDAGGRDGQQSSPTPSPGSWPATGARDTVLHTALQVVSRREHLAHAVPAPCGPEGARGPGWRPGSGPPSRRSVRSARRADRLPGDHGRVRRRAGPLGLRPIAAGDGADQADPAVSQAGREAGPDRAGLVPHRRRSGLDRRRRLAPGDAGLVLGAQDPDPFTPKILRAWRHGGVS